MPSPPSATRTFAPFPCPRVPPRPRELRTLADDAVRPDADGPGADAAAAGGIGSPEQNLPVIHVAGTKGKGSTAAMIAAGLTAAGYRTGLFTSPHIQRIEERIQIDGRCIEDFDGLVDLVRPAVERMDAASVLSTQYSELSTPHLVTPTFFEIITAMAFVHFAREKVDAAVMEVGLGGRLDATNVCRPVVSIITSISFDHTQQLGNTLALIAAEKAGIIKPGVPVVSGVIEPSRGT